jgi:hypothetical protein
VHTIVFLTNISHFIRNYNAKFQKKFPSENSTLGPVELERASQMQCKCRHLPSRTKVHL